MKWILDSSHFESIRISRKKGKEGKKKKKGILHMLSSRLIFFKKILDRYADRFKDWKEKLKNKRDSY